MTTQTPTEPTDDMEELHDRYAKEFKRKIDTLKRLVSTMSPKSAPGVEDLGPEDEISIILGDPGRSPSNQPVWVILLYKATRTPKGLTGLR